MWRGILRSLRHSRCHQGVITLSLLDMQALIMYAELVEYHCVKWGDALVLNHDLTPSIRKVNTEHRVRHLIMVYKIER